MTTSGSSRGIDALCARSCAEIACSAFMWIVPGAPKKRAEVLLRVDRDRGVEAGVDQERPDARVLDQEGDDRQHSIALGLRIAEQLPHEPRLPSSAP